MTNIGRNGRSLELFEGVEDPEQIAEEMDESLENEELFTLAKRAKDKSKKAKPEVDVPIDDFKFFFLIS